VGNIEHLSLNYGWFYELPPLYYFYLNRAGNQEAYWPLFGNVDLKPLRSTAWEVTYRRVVSPQSIYSLTYFYRQYEDLLDTSPYAVPAGARESDPKTILRYENHATARTSGLEMALKRDFGRGFNGAFLYTYLQSVGTASWPESYLLTLARGEERDSTSQAPLVWDQPHTFTFNLGYSSRSGLHVNILAQINSAAIATEWLSGEQNHLPVRNNLDVKVSKPVRWGGLRFEPFVEVRNLLDGRHIPLGQGGLDFSQPISPFGNESGRRIWVGILYR
jgi:outer membrane receptor protein involved in Fe transport